MKHATVNKNYKMLGTARALRRTSTAQERKLWYLFLRDYPVKIYKQRIIESFVVDFYCAQARLVIELDGFQHYEPQGMAYDSERSAFLTALGLEVLRFSNQVRFLNSMDCWFSVLQITMWTTILMPSVHR